jgi:hypothetical protein
MITEKIQIIFGFLCIKSNNNNNNNNNINLTIPKQNICNIKIKVIPAGTIIGTTGTTSKSFRKYLSNLPRKNDIKKLQKTTILGTAHILRKVILINSNKYHYM